MIAGPGGFAAGARPMRLLHLADPLCGGEGSLLACAAATQLPGVDHEAWVLGPPRWVRAARDLGIPSPIGLHTSFGVPESALRALWRVRQARLARWPEGPDAVIAYSPASVNVACRAFALSRSLPIVGLMAAGPESAGRGWLAARRLSRCIHRSAVVPLGQALQRSWAGAAGIGVTGIAPPACEPAGLAARRGALRAQMGLSPGDVAVLLLCDAPGSASVRRFAQVVSMVRLAGAPVVGLACAAAGDWELAARFARRIHRRVDLIRFEGPTFGAIGAADLALWDFPASARAPAWGPLLALSAATAGVPVAAPDRPASRELFDPVATACLATRAGAEQDLARALLPLAADAALREACSLRLQAHFGAIERRYAFHEDLLDTLRIVTSAAREDSAWLLRTASAPQA